jgi:hypothetical protein
MLGVESWGVSRLHADAMLTYGNSLNCMSLNSAVRQLVALMLLRILSNYAIALAIQRKLLYAESAP